MLEILSYYQLTCQIYDQAVGLCSCECHHTHWTSKPIWQWNAMLTAIHKLAFSESSDIQLSFVFLFFPKAAPYSQIYSTNQTRHYVAIILYADKAETLLTIPATPDGSSQEAILNLINKTAVDKGQFTGSVFVGCESNCCYWNLQIHSENLSDGRTGNAYQETAKHQNQNNADWTKVLSNKIEFA